MRNAQTAPEREWLDPDGLATWLGLFDEADEPDRRAVYTMNYNRTGPRFYRIAGKIRYRRSDVETWLESRRVERTATA